MSHSGLKGQCGLHNPFLTTPGYFWWGCFHTRIPMWDHERTCTEVWFPACKEQTQKKIHLSFCSVLWPKRTNPTRCLLTPQVPHATWFSQEDIYIRRLGDLTSDEGLYIHIYSSFAFRIASFKGFHRHLRKSKYDHCKVRVVFCRFHRPLDPKTLIWNSPANALNNGNLKPWAPWKRRFRV